jgi:hypothetical protein
MEYEVFDKDESHDGGNIMSLLPRGVTGLSGLAVDSDKDWLGHLIKNLGAPADESDALRKQDAVLRSLLTQAGQLIYASAPGTPAALALSQEISFSRQAHPIMGGPAGIRGLLAACRANGVVYQSEHHRGNRHLDRL